ncbi:MAG: hypothetical protein G01um101418_927 [Parcubacteria group bacterium Gr01-1014_18]|nr:MAG: hypothetical protein Greene041636_906 [Parcubacteria group bacterium Greene0416_36]TSC79763.1 MAG: hypothetical protein G01um101418_927 [Parcubacteria group bacterium Gr01-1014_18]TSC97901.1 MAG: hypothetical protein Greene101420_936 [Parcubacteria group bacterium Greene1014_20]TSD06021.1 MAG: hypothetical protein Greene07142_952 [Parcubacteria group bacterium Greene0714_2]
MQTFTHLPIPLFIYDGGCQFCLALVSYFKTITNGKIKYASSQEAAGSFSSVISKDDFRRSIYLIMPDGRFFKGAAAYFHLISVDSKRTLGLWVYDHVLGFSWISELVYSWISAHRPWCYRALRFLAGDHWDVLEHHGVQMLFLLWGLLVCIILALLAESLGLSSWIY